MQMFVENARLLILELVFTVHRSIHVKLLSSMVSLEEAECEKWVKQLVEEQTMELTLKEKSVAMNHSVQSL